MAQTTWLRYLFLALLVNSHQSVLRLINKIVPAPYLDEVFHIPQAQRFWQGKWTEWDPKITTPPGVYLWSYAFNAIRGGRGEELSTEDLRFSNAVLLYVLVLGLTLWTTIAKRQVDTAAILQKEFVIVTFPLLFFFSGLYYTDLFSVLTVVFTYAAWEAGKRYRQRRWIFQILHLVVGLLSLASRQTNVFWVGVFLAGLQVVESVKSRVGTMKIHDPDVGNAYLEDCFHFAVSIVHHILSTLPYLVLDLWPQLALLGSFAGFVYWNDGVVLGDKQNHIATIHTPQMLYVWPMMVFFSWPVILSSLASQFQPLTSSNIRYHLPRFWVAGLFTIAMTLSVKFNTIVHPFTLADNRHYTFYVFRILTRAVWIKYAAVPAYFICAWLVITALGHASPGPTKSSKTLKTASPASSVSLTSSSKIQEITFETDEKNDVPLSFVLVWLISTTLSLITAPLVEPRYFIVPWLIWRLHIPAPIVSSISQSTKPNNNPATSNNTPKSSGKKPISVQSSAARTESYTITPLHNSLLRIQQILITYALWVELAWYAVINAGTIHIFLKWGFTWVQEPSLIQRFMW